jgi:ATP-dependent helicase/nuclease subunit A
MSDRRQARLPLDVDPELPDAEARRHAVDPGENVVLEASAGTGKTRVLVERYVNLLRAGVDPDSILAITFTRKAAAEMRQRIIARLKEASALSTLDQARWHELRGRLSDIAISTIDAFCLSLVREFPLEAGADPGFQLADETEVPRLVDESLNRALRIGRGLAREDEDVAMVFVQLGERRLRTGLAALVERRLVARDVLRRFLASGPRGLTAVSACRGAAVRLRDALAATPGGFEAFVADGPLGNPRFAMLARDLQRLLAEEPALDTREAQAAFRALADRVRAYYLTQDGRPRSARGFGGSGFRADHCRSADAWKRHRAAAEAAAPAVAECLRAFRRDLNIVLSRGLRRVFEVAVAQHRRTLDEHAVLDYSEVLARALDLLRQMEEFSRSRFKLESRYRHVLVDEMQDTSRAQWELVSLLVRSWGEGLGAGEGALQPSIFVVGDRKQSIYGFRDADVTLLDEAGRFVEELRPGGRPRRAISVSFRAAPGLLAFVNDVFAEVAGVPDASQRPDRFRYGDTDRFPVDDAGRAREESPVAFIGAPTVEAAAAAVAAEVERLLQAGVTVRDRRSGLPRAAAAGDIAILFRARDSHREYEAALEARGLPTYVYKGLGFFDADEVQDAVALLRFLADPASEPRAAALLRSRIVRLSDRAVTALRSSFSAALAGDPPQAAIDALEAEDRRVLAQVREAMARWLPLVDRVTPSELLDTVLREAAYAVEIAGPRRVQARENLKKLGAMIRRIQNRGYATLGRIADHLAELGLGDESNAVIDAEHAVSLMTVHAAKGLEFPVVFVVNIGRGTGGPRPPVRVIENVDGEPSVAIGDFESEADEDAQARDREETKRLLYVALTRARDRLYLSGVVKDGQLKAGRGSLGEALPASVRRSIATSLDLEARSRGPEA